MFLINFVLLGPVANPDTEQSEWSLAECAEDLPTC